ncbi:hypothetical protein [Propionivibrio sp.]|uniref:hypothetical protein n=1 Tax=Propionivibrio sp. TaxID=2212460 RepID=UPI002624FCE5|nr:hypothetical protein [Propionivibrio sp.]
MPGKRQLAASSLPVRLDPGFQETILETGVEPVVEQLLMFPTELQAHVVRLPDVAIDRVLPAAFLVCLVVDKLRLSRHG